MPPNDEAPTPFATRLLDGDRPLPLVVEPASGGAQELLNHPSSVWERLLDRHGGLLLRGFDLAEVSRFERFARSLLRDVFRDNSEHQPLTADGAVQTPVAYAATKQLLWHNENSFNRRWPTRILFGCRRPAERGGETPVVDSRLVFERIEPRVRERFVERGVCYVRNYHPHFGLSWQQVFRCDDRDEVERRCADEGIHTAWNTDGRLRTRAVRPAAVRHPRTAEWSWFNQAQHWHMACLDDRTRRGLQRLFAEEDVPRHCTYGDGTPIDDDDMRGILTVYRDLEVRFGWQRGDVLAVDNVLTAHGRAAYTGAREILVSLGDMLGYDDVETSGVP